MEPWYRVAMVHKTGRNRISLIIHPLIIAESKSAKIWTTTELNHYLNFPYVGQAFVIERQSIEKRPANTPVKSPTASPA